MKLRYPGYTIGRNIKPIVGVIAMHTSRKQQQIEQGAKQLLQQERHEAFAWSELEDDVETAVEWAAPAAQPASPVRGRSEE